VRLGPRGVINVLHQQAAKKVRTLRPDQSHLFFLNHQMVSPVAIKVIPIAISYPYFHLNSWIPSKFIPYQVPTIMSGVVITVISVSSLIISPV
jgi:hypothetical protein